MALSDKELNALFEGEASTSPENLSEDERLSRSLEQFRRPGQRQPGGGGDLMGPIQGAALGFTTGLINLLGAPSKLGQDLENLGRRQLGVPEVTGEPALGPRQLKNWAVSAGIMDDAEFDDLSGAGRVGFRVGEVVGASIPFAAAPFALARFTNIGTGVAAAGRAGAGGTGTTTQNLSAGVPEILAPTPAATFRGRVAQSITTAPRFAGPAARGAVESTRRAPGLTASAEAGSILGAAQGSALAEAAVPGNDVVRLLLEGTGAIVNPIGMLARAGHKGLSGFFQATKSLTRAGREQKAAEIVQDIVLNTGGDPSHLARSLEAADEFGLRLTSAQKSGSKALAAMEEALAKRNVGVARTFGSDRQALARDAGQDLRNFVDELVRTGDPKSLATAAAVRNRHFDDLLTRRVQQMEQEVAEAQARIGTTSAEARATASTNSFNIATKALQEARLVEQSLWRKIPGKLNVNPTRLNSVFRSIRQEMPMVDASTGARRAPPLAKEVQAVTSKTDGVLQDTQVKELLNIRQEALEQMRVALAAKEFNKARRLGQIEEAIRSDISALELPQIQEARDFSRILNDKFTRSFGGDILARSKEGDFRIPPEELLGRAFGQGRERGARQLRELEEAVQFGEEAAVRRGTSEPGMFVGAVRNQEEAIIRDAAAQVIEGGNVSPDRLQRFLQQNDGLLARFPELRAQLSDVESAQRLFITTERAIEGARKQIMRKAAFARLAGVENPARAVGQALDGNTPMRDFQRFAALAKRSGKGATDGLKVSVLDYARQVARDQQDGFSFRVMRNKLYNKQAEALPPIMRMMRENGVINQGEADRLKRILDRAVEIEDLMRSPEMRGSIPEDVDPMFDLAVRIAGANLGGASAAGQASGASLVLAGAASRTLRRQLEKIPFTRTLDILIEASEQPQLMAALLRKPVNIKMREQQEQIIRSALLQAGLIPEEEGNE